MLNLLFISDSSKAEYIKSVLQPVLKVLIDVATDFDQGLKDVFSKRPAVVCIQDQIGGVTGESVARHIQMLLGMGSPVFILLHAGNGNARAIKGVYESLIDLNQPNEELAEAVKSTLALLLGDQWEKIQILPKQPPVSVRPLPAISEAAREAADKLVDEFLYELEKPGLPVAVNALSAPPLQDNIIAKAPDVEHLEVLRRAETSPGTIESERAQVINDDLAEILSSYNSSTAKAPAVSNAKKEVPLDAALPDEPPASHKPPAAEFRISQDTQKDEAHFSDDLLLEFEGNYRSRPLFLRRSTILVVFCAICAAGGWYLVSQQLLPGALLSWLKPAPLAKPALPPQQAAPPVQKPLAAPVPQPAKGLILPAFIPKEGLDSSFSSKNPGWERYVGKTNEFRLFTASGRLQAIQVLALKDAPVQVALLNKVLKEFAGTKEYQITARSMKSGVRVERGKIKNNGEVVIYRKNGAVKAFVVSVN